MTTKGPEQVRLSEDLETQTIAQMVNGDTFFTVPWAMWVDKKRRCWLDPDYTVHQEKGGTVQMGVAKSEDGYSVDITSVDNPNWELQEHSTHVGHEDSDWIPVIGITR
jgi:hypothetical protein